MKSGIFLLMLVIYGLMANGQKSQPALVPGLISYYDTVKAKSRNYFVLHYHEVSKQRKRQMMYSDGRDIFNDSLNTFSRMIVIAPFGEINFPTIPLDNIIIMEDKGLIIGLTQVQASPYLVVIYNMDGKLLYKGNLGVHVLRLTRDRLTQLISRYPNLLECFETANCFKEGDTCFLEYSSCTINTIGRDKALDVIENDLVWEHYASPFPVSTDSGIYPRYSNLYSCSNPIYDLITIGDVPYLLVLNTEDGRKINIPLVSNIELRHWLKIKEIR